MEAAVPYAYVDALNRTLDHQIKRVSAHSRILSLEVAALEGLTDPLSIYPIIQTIHTSLMAALEARSKHRTAEPALPLEPVDA